MHSIIDADVAPLPEAGPVNVDVAPPSGTLDVAHVPMDTADVAPFLVADPIDALDGDRSPLSDTVVNVDVAPPSATDPTEAVDMRHLPSVSQVPSGANDGYWRFYHRS